MSDRREDLINTADMLMSDGIADMPLQDLIDEAARCLSGIKADYSRLRNQPDHARSILAMASCWALAKNLGARLCAMAQVAPESEEQACTCQKCEVERFLNSL